MLVNAGYSHVPLLWHRDWPCAIGCFSYHSPCLSWSVLLLCIFTAIICVVMSQCWNWISLSHCRNPENAKRHAVASWMFDNNGCALTISDRMSTNIGIFFWTGLTSDLLRLLAVACTKVSELATALLHPIQCIDCISHCWFGSQFLWRYTRNTIRLCSSAQALQCLNIPTYYDTGLWSTVVSSFFTNLSSRLGTWNYKLHMCISYRLASCHIYTILAVILDDTGWYKYNSLAATPMTLWLTLAVILQHIGCHL